MGCYVDNLTMEETILKINEFILSKTPHQHVVLNADKIVKANRNPQLLEIINNCDLINADGASVVLASKLLKKPLKERVTGIDLFEKLIEKAAFEGWKVFLLGAREEIIVKIISILRQKYPNLNIVDYCNGYWKEDQEADVVRQIKMHKPDLLFVAISSPKKEQFINKYILQMDVPFTMGVGGAFDVIAGLTKRAPLWMQKSSLEWFYRFIQEPRRMFKRYFIDDFYFFYLFARNVLKREDRNN